MGQKGQRAPRDRQRVDYDLTLRRTLVLPIYRLLGLNRRRSSSWLLLDGPLRDTEAENDEEPRSPEALICGSYEIPGLAIRVLGLDFSLSHKTNKVVRLQTEWTRTE